MTTKGSEFERRIAQDPSDKEKAASEKLIKQTRDAADAEAGKAADGVADHGENTGAGGNGPGNQVQGGRR
jgi:hypothetical protein